MITFNDIKNDERIRTYITKADESLSVLGYTEHSFAHVGKVARTAGKILRNLNYSDRTAELAEIAGYLHDIGNLVNRSEHSQSGAVLAFQILSGMNMPPDEIATIATAIGNHDEGTGIAVNPVAAALIIADKSDVRRSRVRNKDMATFDIHDRVNYSVKDSNLVIHDDVRHITLEIDIDTKLSSVMNYFEIFLGRMIMCRKAAEALDTKFNLIINGQQLL